MIEFEKEGNGNFRIIFSQTRHLHTRVGLYGRQHTDYLVCKETFFGRNSLIDCLLTFRTWECKILSEEWV
jgi:hypothetical protein